MRSRYLRRGGAGRRRDVRKRWAFLIGIGAGAALAWLLDDRRQGDWFGRADEAALVAPPTPMSGPVGAGRPADSAVAAPEDATAADEESVRPTPATAGALPLTDETAGGHQILAGGPSAAP
jgi:hypothetical protein